MDKESVVCVCNERCSPLGQRVLWTKMAMEASGSDSVLHLKPVIVFTYVTSWARTHPLYWTSMLLSRIWFYTWNIWLALWYHLWRPSILWRCRDLCAAAQRFVTPAGQVHIRSRHLSSASLPPVSAIVTPAPGFSCFQIPVLSFSVCCSFLPACSP